MLKWKRKQWLRTYAVLSGALFLAAAGLAGMQDGLRVTALDVGQGDAILIQTPEGKTALIDAGEDTRTVDQLSREMGFFGKTIDLFIVTHPHRDHHGGALDVMRKYRINAILLTGAMSRDPFYDNFIREARERHIPLLMPTQERDIRLSETVFLDVLFPLTDRSFAGQEIDNKNNASVAVRLTRLRETGDLEPLMVLSGDAEREEEMEILLSGQALQAHALKAGHHGSRTSTTLPWLRAVAPKTVVISTGKDNTFGHPHPETLDKLKNLETHITMEEGAVHFVF